VRVSVRWFGVLAIAAGIVGFLVFGPLDSGEQTAAVGQSVSEQETFSDGRGNDLIEVGLAAGQPWYCETQGVVASVGE